MPLYTYLNLTTGKHEEHMRTIAERDTLGGYERILEFPRAVKVVNPSAGGRLTVQAQQVLDGYKKLEERGENRKTRSEASAIKDLWRDDSEDRETAETTAAATQEANQES